jgi:hypothetical protein
LDAAKNNKAADGLTRRAMRQIRFDQRCYQTAVNALSAHAGRRKRSNLLLPLIDLRVYQPVISP